MNRFFTLCFFIVTVVVIQSVGAQVFPEKTNYPPYYSGINGHITDLCLLYCARPYPMVPYTKETMKKYLVYSDKGQTRFLFDGFILLDIRSTTNQPLENNPLTATQNEWTLLMNRYFEEGWAASAIDQALEDLKAENIVPVRKRKIVMGIPVPYAHKFSFGTIDGKRMTMETVESRIRAAQWYVDEVLRRWQDKKYKNIELAGFYWVEEHARENGDQIIPVVSDYVKAKGYRMVWIPYYGSANAFAKHWKSLGFDMAYQQPNYFFVRATQLGIPATRLYDATKFASDNGMAMEFEFDHNVFDTLYQRKFTEYVDYFERNKVFERTAVAYYEGGGAWPLIADTNNPDIRALYQRLAGLIADRQEKADGMFVNRQPALYEGVSILNKTKLLFQLPVDKVSLFSANGSMVRYYASTNEVSLENLKGFYILNYIHEDNRYSRKLVIL